jgi:hypothetical protein
VSDGSRRLLGRRDLGTVVRTAAWVLLFASLGGAAASWFTPTPELGADDATDLAVDALAEADVEVDRVRPPRRAEHRTEEGEAVDVWVVIAETRVDGEREQLELRVQRSAGRLVYVDDRIGPDDAERLLTDDEFDALGAHRDDSLADRWVLRNGLGVLSALVIAAVCYVLATRSEHLPIEPRSVP